MNHSAAPFVPRGYQPASVQLPTQPLTPPLNYQHHHHQHHGGAPYAARGPPSAAYGVHGAPHPSSGYPAHPQYAPSSQRPPMQYDMYQTTYPPQYNVMHPHSSEPPAYHAPSKLRAVASEYIPPHRSFAETVPFPSSAAGARSITSTAQAPNNVGQGLDGAILNPDARPYVHQQTSGVAVFPSSVPQERSTTAPTKAKSPVSPSCGSQTTPLPPASSGPTTPGTPMSPMNSDPFKTSILPVPNVPNPPSEVKLGSSWTLYAAEVPPLTLGSQTAVNFQPCNLKTISDIEGFWRLWRTIKPPSQQTPSFTLYFFRRSVNPTWEDPRNAAGGTITIPLWDRDRAGFLEKTQVDDAWLLIAMLLVGESLPNPHVLTGAVLKIRPRNTVLQLWSTTANKADLQPTLDAARQHLSRTFTAVTFGSFDFVPHAASKGAAQNNKSQPHRTDKEKSKEKGGKPTKEASGVAPKWEPTFKL